MKNANVCPIVIKPSDATNQNVTWESSDTSVVSINNTLGTITANAQGNAVITVKATDTSSGSVHSSKCMVTVIQPVTGVSVSQATAALTLDGTQMLDLDETIFPSDATNQEVTWTSSDTSVAVVDSDGVVMPVSKGKAMITVIATDTSSGHSLSATCAVTVSEPVSSSQPTPQPTPQPTAAPTAKPTPALSSTPTPKPTAKPTATSVGATIVEENADTSEIIIEINTTDLPSGTVSIQLPSGEVIALNGSDTIQFTVSAYGLNNEAISIITLNDEGTPLATLDVQIDKGETTTISATPSNAGDGLLHVLLWILISIVGASIIVGVAFIIIRIKRQV